MGNAIHLSFSIGPVQGFVAQARRTRDLWAGSWLLSYLAECALVAAEQAGGNTIIPHRPQPKVITSKQTAIGGIPNRFEVRFEGEDAREEAQRAGKASEAAFRNAWLKVATAVRETFVEPVAHHGRDALAIWDRQVGSFWELSWVVGEPDGDSSTIGRLAAMRKNFRQVSVADEAGTKCSLISTLQEISGHSGRGQWDSQAQFWKGLREQKGIKGLNLAENERLCAIALIKRLFALPQCIEQAIGSDISDELRDASSWPSTAFVAALPWLRALKDDALQQAQEFADAARQAHYELTERNAARHAGVNWAGVDGPAWFRSTLQSALRSGDDSRELDRSKLPGLIEQQRDLYKAAGGPPVPYYALLLMDGDSMGELVGRLGSPQDLSACLGRFASEVHEVIQPTFGRTIYAGGDDVLALVSAKDALSISMQLCDRYRTVFEGPIKDGRLKVDEASISAAIIYAHWRYPLRQVLSTAHKLLDDVAKDRTGRDSVAMGIVLGSGLNAVWSAPWSVVRGKANGSTDLPTLLKQFSSDTQDERAEFNASYLYLLRERFGRLLSESKDQPGEYAKLHSAYDTSLLRDLAHAEYRRRMSKSELQATPHTETEAIVNRLMSLSYHWQRKKSGDGCEAAFSVEPDPLTFAFDGWRVARFLKQVQDGKVQDHD